MPVAARRPWSVGSAGRGWAARSLARGSAGRGAATRRILSLSGKPEIVILTGTQGAACTEQPLPRRLVLERAKTEHLLLLLL